MSRYQNSGSQSAAGTRRPRRGGREGVLAWSAAWTAAATSCAVSASMTMFRRSRTRRTTCPACGGASCGPMVAGSVTPGTVEETVLVRLPDTPDLQRLLRRSPGGTRPVRGPAGDHVVNRSIYNTDGRPQGNGRPRGGRGISASGVLDGVGRTEMLSIFVSSRPGAVRPGATGVAVPGSGGSAAAGAAGTAARSGRC